MVSNRQLLESVEAALLAGPQLPPRQRAEIAHLLHLKLPDFQSFLQYPAPKARDRTQVLSKEVRLPNAPPTPLDDQDVHIALKLSDDLYLNEVECVALLVAAHQEWSLLGREPLETLRLAAGLWFTERRALITTLQILLRAVVLDEELHSDFVVDIRQYLEGLFKSGLRQRLITLIKDLNREEPAGSGGSGVEQYVIDSHGALVQRSNVALRERLSLCQCLVFSCLIVRIGATEIKELYSLLKDCSRALDASQETVKLQIAHTVLFIILIALISDALSGSQEMVSVLSPDSLFRREFQEQIMENIADETVEGFTGVIRLAWAVFLMLTSSAGVPGSLSLSSTSENNNVCLVLDRACEHNAFRFLVNRILKTPAFQNDDNDMIFMYSAYLHKLLTSFLSQPLGRDKVKELRDLAMIFVESYYYDSTYSLMDDDSRAQQQTFQAQAQPFTSLLELITEVYQQAPELTLENDVLWNFVRFASEDHTSHVTLVAFLTMLTALASSEEGAKKVYLLLQGKTARSISWHTLFNSLNVYEEHFTQSFQASGALLPPFQEGDAKALEAYLQVLKKVMQNGNKVERSQWFLDIEPLFKLLSFENVPPYLKGALRNAIATFVGVSPVMKDKVWTLLQQYDLPMVVGSSVAGDSLQQRQPQAYDMAFELNEVEARREEYPSTVSYVRLINVLISYETDVADQGSRFFGIFKFVRDQVFASYSQRAYSDQVEKWQLVVACLQHFQMMLSLYDPIEEDIRSQVNLLPELQNGTPIQSPSVTGGQAVQLPTIDVMKDLMSGKTIFRNVMSILMLGVNVVLEERMSQSHGLYLEEAVRISLELLLLALNKDIKYANVWRPVYQPLDAVLAHDNRQIVALLEYVRYDVLPAIQHCSIQLLTILSARMPQLVSIILEAGIAANLIEDYAACLEARSQDVQAPENSKEDAGFLILQLLLSNLSRPAPNITHLLFKFDLDSPVERTILQPKQHYSCLRVMLNVLDTLSKPDANAILHEYGFQLFYELAVDTVTSAATIELLQAEKYKFFSKHLNTFACESLPKRSTNLLLRTSSLHQRAWLLKLLALELHVSDMDVINQREICRELLSCLFIDETSDWDGVSGAIVAFMKPNMPDAPTSGLKRMKVLELLEVVQFQTPEIQLEFPWELQDFKDDFMVSDILGKPATVEEGGVYYHSERGDRLIDLAAFRDQLWQEYKRVELQQNISFNEQRQAVLRDAVQQLLRWGWKYNKNIEEQAAQLHMLVGWSQLVEVGISRRFELLNYRLQIVLEILDASLSATTSPDCSLKMALSLSQVVMTCVAKLQELSLVCPAGNTTDDVTCMNLLSSARLSNSACRSILSKLIASLLRPESSEALRRRQYTTLICYLHYCRGTVDPDISLPVMRSLLLDGHDGEEDRELEKLDREQAELMQINLSIVKHEAKDLTDVLAKDITQGTETGKIMAFYALDAVLGMDSDQVILSQLQSRGLLQSCLRDISTNSYQAVLMPSPTSVRHLYTLEAELALLLRVGYQNKKRGAQMLFAMGTLQHLTSCRAIDIQLSEDARWEQVLRAGIGLPSQHERHHQIVSPVLRLVLCLTSLIERGDHLEKDGNEVASEVLEFIKAHHGLFSRILRDDRSGVQVENLEELELVTAILSKVWHLETADSLGLSQALFSLASVYFCHDGDSKNRYVLYVREAECLPSLASETREIARRLELLIAQLRCNLICFLYNRVANQGLRLHFTNPSITPELTGQLNLGRHIQPTLKLVASLLEQVASDLDTVVEEMSLLLAKVQDVNELSRHEVDEIIKAYSRVERTGDGDNIRKRRYVAMVEMCSAAGNREGLISHFYYIIEHALNILYMHFEKDLQLPEQLRRAVENIDYVNSYFGTKEELNALNEKLLPTLQRLERMNEERTGRSNQQIQRLVRSLKSRIVLGIP